VAGLRTEVTEIATGLAMLGYQTIDRALEVRPRHIAHVDEPVFDRLEQAWASGAYDDDFEAAWSNGQAFARSPLGLRGRPPWELEWKGHHKPASKAIETIPADLRVDHVFLISCKYRSRILHNAGPSTLFEHALAPSGPVARSDWFETVSPDAYRAVWQPILDAAGVPVGAVPSSLTTHQRAVVADAANQLDTDTTEYADFVTDVSQRSALRWAQRLRTSAARNEMYWRLLRMQAAPYFVLGLSHAREPMRYRVGTPWDFAQRYSLTALDVTAGRRGQPSVDWKATVNGDDGVTRTVAGHVEVRWSHGKLNGSPEAKVYLDTPPADVPGYDHL
jgi:hypothetical protein